MLGSFDRSRNRPTKNGEAKHTGKEEVGHTLFAGFDLNFSKIFCDWDLGARLMA